MTDNTASRTASRTLAGTTPHRSPSAPLLIGTTIALSTGVQIAVFAVGMFVASSHDIHRSEGVKASLISVLIVAAAASVVAIAVALATRGSASRGKVGAIVLGVLSVLSIPIYWAGGPAIFGGLAAWRGGLTKDGKPHTGAARTLGIIGLVAAVLDIVAVLVLTLGNVIQKRRLRRLNKHPCPPIASLEAYFPSDLETSMSGVLRRRTLACTFIAVLAGLALAAPPTAEATPRPRPARALDLGVVAPYDESFAHGVADNGTVVGELDRNEQDVAPFVYRHGRMRILPGLGGDFGYASKINDRGVITGTASDAAGNPHAVVWTHDGRHVRDLGIAPGDDSSFGTGVNDNETVAGDTDSGNDARPALFARGRVLVLTPSAGDLGAAEDVDGRGRVVGLSFAPDGIQRAQVWDSYRRPATDLGTLPGGDFASLLSVDRYGRAGGGGNTGADPDQTHAIVWPGHGPLLTLRPLSGRTADDFAVVRELGAHGEAVGASQDADGDIHATVWFRAFDQTVVPAPVNPSSRPTPSVRPAIMPTAVSRTLTQARLSR